MTANLEPGEYDMTCGLLSNPKGKLTVTVAAGEQAPVKPDAMALVGPIAEYKVYVTQEVAQLVSQTKAFTDAVKAGDLALARKLYAPTRQHYERIEPIAELFSDLDGSIDAREDDFEQKSADPKFTGFHRLEKSCLEITQPKVQISLQTCCIRTHWNCKTHCWSDICA